MAKVLLMVNGALIAACAVSVVSGCAATGKYPKRNPEEVGDRVERLHQEMLRALIAKPVSDSGTKARTCYEDWQKKKSVKVRRSDPWKVDYSQFEFGVSVVIPVQEQGQVRSLYDALVRNLQAGAGWKAGESHNTAGVVSGVEAGKQGVHLSAFDTPDGRGGHTVYANLQTDCYRHPDA
ncbi:hypothetical protein [Actinomadura verrucosospora]|uniref:hypothetical protein n=1 Tax=Actinomadura verrucosospora TaxID=46165 RepID=UPI001564162E|nr:hypothetical protein [Actinomadura verrucosospora]